MPLLIVFLGLILLLVLITALKIDAFIAFVVVSIAVGIAEGMKLSGIITSVEKGIGDTLGSIILILALGAMLGKLIAQSGAARKITTKLLEVFGIRYVQWAVVLAGFLVGIPMFYTVGFVIMVPLIFTVAETTGLPLLFVGIPMLASLSVTHGYLPPHPSPTAIAVIFHADIGKTLMYGIIVALPAIILAGPLFARTIKKIQAKPLAEFVHKESIQNEKLPGTFVSLTIALLPVILIGIATLADLVLNKSMIREILDFIGNPTIALLLAVLAGIYVLGIRRGQSMKEVMNSLSASVSSIAMIILIIGGAGILKQVLVDSGVSSYIGDWLKNTNIHPLLLAWLIAAIIRVCVGSATVAGLTAASIVASMLTKFNVRPELMVLAIGSGSLMLSHVNDAGFWLFKEYFNVSVKDTFLTWTVMETMVGIVGLIGVLTLNFLL